MNKQLAMFTTITNINHINTCENQVCSSCVIDKLLITKRVRHWSDDDDDQDDEYDSKVFP